MRILRDPTQIHPLCLRLAEWEELIGITILPGLFDLEEVRLDNFARDSVLLCSVDIGKSGAWAIFRDGLRKMQGFFDCAALRPE